MTKDNINIPKYSRGIGISSMFWVGIILLLGLVTVIEAIWNWGISETWYTKLLWVAVLITMIWLGFKLIWRLVMVLHKDRFKMFKEKDFNPKRKNH